MPSAGQRENSWARALPSRRGFMPDLTGTRQSRRDGFIDNGRGTAMQPTPRDELRDYEYCASIQVFLQIKK